VDHIASAASASPAAAQGDAVLSGSTIEQAPLAKVPVERPAQSIRVNPGDTVESLAAVSRADPSAIRWANSIIDVSQPAPGSTLLIPPASGALLPVLLAGERPSQFASRLGLDPRILLDYNALPSDDPRPGGTYLQVPRAAAPSRALRSSDVVPVHPGVPGVPSTQASRAPNGEFPWGQCTYYVSSRRSVSWSGDAGAWFVNARQAGRPTGQVPVQGAIVVIGGSWVGHVGYIERVNPDGSFVISEWNVRGLGIYDERTVTVHDIYLIGFIY
jgi:N-acetylmuramoyl-L-alanine amidase